MLIASCLKTSHHGIVYYRRNANETFLRQWFITRLESCLLQFADRVSWKSKEIACIAIVSNFIKWCFIQWKVILAGQVCGQRSLWCQLGLKMINCFIFSFFSSSEKLKFDPDPDFINRLIPFSRDSRHASIQFSSIIISYCRSKSFESITTKKMVGSQRIDIVFPIAMMLFSNLLKWKWSSIGTDTSY